jgi:hypothetical protein
MGLSTPENYRDKPFSSDSDLFSVAAYCSSTQTLAMDQTVE